MSTTATATFIDIRDDQGLLLCRYAPELNVVELLVHYYDGATRKHKKERRVVALPQPVVTITIGVEVGMVDKDATLVV